MAQAKSPGIDFAHHNRDFTISSRDALLEVLKTFASDYFVDRRFEGPERVTVSGNVVVREGWYVGTAKVDLPGGFGMAGEAFRLRFCSVRRYDDDGVLVEGKNHG